jgi:hypothetical protein
MMTTKLKMLPVRVSPALRALIDQVGPVNAATRALIILGAETAELDLTGMEREVAGLLTEDLASGVLDRLRRILLQGASDAAEVTDTVSINDRGQSVEQRPTSIVGLGDDPFAAIGVEV